MDHRWYERMHVRLSVAIHDGTIGLIMGKTRDVSREGMFVELPNVVVDEDLVVLSISSPIKGGNPITNVLATVVHRSRHGVGLCLKNYRFKPGMLAPYPRALSS